MKIQITARHFDSTEGLKATVETEINRLEKFYERILSCHVVLDAENKKRMKAEITINMKAHTVVAKAEDEVMGKAIDDALVKIEKQLKKINAKIHDHRKVPEKNVKTKDEEDDF